MDETSSPEPLHTPSEREPETVEASFREEPGAERVEMPTSRQSVAEIIEDHIAMLVSTAMANNLQILRAGLEHLKKESPAVKDRFAMMGMGITSVSGNERATISISPQIIFRPQFLYIPPEIAPDFEIEDIKVGQFSQTVAAGGMPASAFTFQKKGMVPLDCDVCMVGMHFSVSVRNLNPAQRNFTAMVFGKALK